MKKSFLNYITFVLLLGLLNYESVSAVEVTIDGPPGNYRVFSLRGRTLGNLSYARNFDEFTFNIPDEHVIRRDNGEINLEASLQKWRRDTPVAQGNPRTQGGIGYYPFRDSRGNYRYIALEHIYDNHSSRVNYEAPTPTVEPTVTLVPTPTPTPPPQPEPHASGVSITDIPSDYIVLNERGHIDADQTIANWQSSTPETPTAAPDTDFEINLADPPGGYRVFDLEGNGRLAQNGQNARDFRSFNFQVPDEYLIRDADGEVDFRASLRNWRESETSVAEGNPRTDSRGIHYYPFMDSNGDWKYIALEHIHDNYPEAVEYAEVEEGEGDTELRVQQRPDPQNYAQAADGEESDEISGSDRIPLQSVPRPQARPADLDTSGCGTLCNDFPPREAGFVESWTPNNSAVRRKTNVQWWNMSHVEQGEYLMDKYAELVEHMNPACDYSPRVLTCKAYRESTFSPHLGSPASTAVGIGQILRGTLRDVVSPRIGFRSSLPRYRHLRTYEQFNQAQRGDMVLQMELSIGVLDMKKRDNRLSCNNMSRFLYRYFGGSHRASTDYASDIMSCATCIRDNGNQVTQRCLGRAK